MKFMYAIEESNTLLQNNSNGIYSALQEHDVLDGLLKTNISVHIQKFVNMKNFNQLINTYRYNEALEIILGSKREIKESFDTATQQIVFDSFIDSLRDFALQQDSSKNLSDIEKFHYLLRNILQSIFGDITQISQEFNYQDGLIDIDFKDNHLNIHQFTLKKKLANTLFVETPLIIEFEAFLPTQRFKTPYHIDSLLEKLNNNAFDFTSDELSDFIIKFKDSSANIINGNISKGLQGFIFESKSGKSYHILNASSGIKSIGLLQYLVTNKALKKGSVLFWEEPEVHLHPKWQLKMVDLFVELMNAGVKIVFSTHSPYMADYLNAISKKQKFRDRVSFNLLQESDGVVINHILENQQDWNKIQTELLDPLEEIMWEYV
ncbi:MAG: hypothetical protein KN64_10675 [Sulfurovum sp. AS07-7]|nr:MAG: hypothetical protein KN64_10675 [Sulfurovum sp. AS07-7]